MPITNPCEYLAVKIASCVNSDLRLLVNLAIMLWFCTTNPSLAKSDEDASRAMIHQLVSRNAPPISRAPLPQEFPPEFDQKENERVIAVRDAILAKGLTAFPILIEHLDDTRYSYSTDNVNWKVWQVCLSLISTQVQVYECADRTQNFVPPRYLPYSGVKDNDDSLKRTKRVMKEWWAQRERQSLHDIQAEAVAWAINHERQRGFRDKDEEAIVVGWLNRLMARLNSSSRAIRVDYDGEFPDERELQPDRGEWYERWGEMATERAQRDRESKSGDKGETRGTGALLWRRRQLERGVGRGP